MKKTILSLAFGLVCLFGMGVANAQTTLQSSPSIKAVKIPSSTFVGLSGQSGALIGSFKLTNSSAKIVRPGYILIEINAFNYSHFNNVKIAVDGIHGTSVDTGVRTIPGIIQLNFKVPGVIMLPGRSALVTFRADIAPQAAARILSSPVILFGVSDTNSSTSILTNGSVPGQDLSLQLLPPTSTKRF